MEWTSSEVVKVISFLLPGFLAAWVFHGLTAHRPRREPFERVVQALIFTALIRALLPPTQRLWQTASQHVALPAWSDEVSATSSLAIAASMGVGFALLANRGWFHGCMRLVGITKRTSFPSEWFSVFNSAKRYIILHLKDGRRLSGWPYEWPEHDDSGHFVMCHAEWLDDENKRIELPTIEFVVIPVQSVELVEIEKRMKDVGEIEPPCGNETAPSSKGSANGEDAAAKSERIATRVDGQAVNSPTPASAAVPPATQNQMNRRHGKKGRR